MDINSLAHTKWNCKYHIVFAPKYRRKVAYGKMKQDIAYTYGLRTPCKFKIQIWESPFLVQRILRRYCRENAKKIQEYIFKISYTGRLIYAYSHYNMCAGCFCLL